jgi:hypothetical protein
MSDRTAWRSARGGGLVRVDDSVSKRGKRDGEFDWANGHPAEMHVAASRTKSNLGLCQRRIENILFMKTTVEQMSSLKTSLSPAPAGVNFRRLHQLRFLTFSLSDYRYHECCAELRSPAASIIQHGKSTGKKRCQVATQQLRPTFIALFWFVYP